MNDENWIEKFEHACRVCKRLVSWDEYATGPDCCLECKMEFRLDSPERKELMDWILYFRENLRSDFSAEA